MSDPAPASLSSQVVRVLILAGNPARQAYLRALVLEAGHQPVQSVCEANVVLSDAECSPSGDRPVIVLGGEEADQAGLLDLEPTPAQIDAALRAVVAGLVVRSPGLAPPGFAPFDDNVFDALLTPREVDVLKCIGDGLTNKLIARRLNISLHTVKFHIESLLRKLGATTRAQALARALERRYLGTIEF